MLAIRYYNRVIAMIQIVIHMIKSKGGWIEFVLKTQHFYIKYNVYNMWTEHEIVVNIMIKGKINANSIF